MSASNIIDPRIKLLSYSSLLSLHNCPREFELYRKKATDDEMEPLAASNQNITFAFGHVVGEGIQAVLAGATEDEAILILFKGWHADLLARDDKRNKSFWEAVIAIQRFIHLRNNGFLDGWELLYYQGKPAIELSFIIEFPDGFKMRGSVDAVLKHTATGKIKVLEGKTTASTTLYPSQYKNSAQGIGYSVVLDTIAPDISSYEVLYLVYMCKSRSYEQLTFPKTYLQRAQWIQELLLDIETIKLYETAGVYPMRGESCRSFGRECDYYQQCTMSNRYITKPYNQEEFELDNSKVYDVRLTLMDLINTQLNKNVLSVVNSTQEVDSENVENVENIDNIDNEFNIDVNNFYDEKDVLL